MEEGFFIISIFSTRREEPDVVFLQEVIPVAFDLIRNLLPEYDSYTGSIR